MQFLQNVVLSGNLTCIHVWELNQKLRTAAVVIKTRVATLINLPHHSLSILLFQERQSDFSTVSLSLKLLETEWLMELYMTTLMELLPESISME